MPAPSTVPPRMTPSARAVVIAAVLVMIALLAHAQPAGPERPQAIPFQDLSQAGPGELLWQGPEGFVPLPILDLAVRVEVNGMLMHGTLTETFRNTLPQTIDCVYVFPLPERAALHRMEMRIGERRIESIVRERTAARRAYEAARGEGRKAALVDQERPNLFTVSVANLNPDETVEVRLDYLQEVRYEDGGFGLAVPLTFTPRFVPAGVADAARLAAPQLPAAGTVPVPAPQAAPARRAAAPGGRVPAAMITARINAGLDVEEVTSASHAVRTWWDGGALEIEPRGGPAPADRDFLLAWRRAPSADPRPALFVEDREDGRYLFMMILPPHGDGGPEAVAAGPGGGAARPRGFPTRTIFVVDVSGSMDGPPIRQARLALLAALDRLSPDDTFAILAFNEEVHPFAPGFAPAAGAALDGARAWVAALEAGGGTLIGHALRTALGMMEESATGDDGVLSRIVFLTDGAVGNEDEVVRAIHRHPGRVRLHTLGIGPAPNRHLMRQMAEAGRGLSGFIASIEGVDNRIDAFLARLDRPVLAEPRLEWDGPPPADVHPAILPDLHAGEPLLVSARLAPGVSPGRPFLTGRGPHGPVRLPIDPAPAAGSDRGIAVRWARARIEALMDGVHAGADPDAVRRAVIDLSLAFGIVSPFTSMVAVERFPTAATDAGLVRVPSALPSAGSGDLVLAQGGTDDALRFLIGLALLAVGGLLMLCDRLVSQGGVFPGHPPARSPGGFVGRLRAVRPWRRARS